MAAYSQGTTNMTASEPIQVKAGQNFTIKMESNPTTGYGWQLSKALDNKISLVTNAFIPPDSKLCGAGGHEVWTFKAIEQGQVEISMNYVRPWDNPQTFTVLPMPFDYNQDGVDDLGYYYRGTNMPTSGWSILYVGAGTDYYVWGSSGSLPAPGNYRSQTFDVPRGICIYKVTTTDWFVPYLDLFKLGTYGQTLPVPAGDYDGNGYDDNAVYNYVTGEWTIIYNTGGGNAVGREQVSGIFGGPGAVPANIYSTIYALARYSPKPW